MNSNTFYIDLFLLLALAIFAGEILTRYKQVSLVGQVFIGILIGPSILNIITANAIPALLPVSDISVFFIMLIAGIELDPRSLIKSSKNAVVVSITSFFIPFVIGLIPGILYHYSLIITLFLALCISITALPVSAIILSEIGVINKKIGYDIMTACVINDILAMFVFSLLLILYSSGTLTFIIFIISVLKIALFLSTIITAYMVISSFSTFSYIVSKILNRLKTKEIDFALLLVVALAISFFGMYMGLAFVTGTFFSGLLVNKDSAGDETYEKITSTLSPITYGFFVPLFFAIIGLELIIKDLYFNILLFGLFLIIAIVGKIFGGFIGARINGVNKIKSVFIGFIMNGRGMIELVIASIAFSMGIINETIFTIIVGVGIITTLISPIGASILMNRYHIEFE
ncbi:MAG: cation:proton antiporter [Candidatus Thermoplasmatota archaeon]|nr:cation:proton antiporter [Candidatus Thermoplasmatota archaeon]MCL5963340.1 cation:proton antiporter [Candidatus Thermoplasmatota archaeon]